MGNSEGDRAGTGGSLSQRRFQEKKVKQSSSATIGSRKARKFVSPAKPLNRNQGGRAPQRCKAYEGVSSSAR